MENNNVKRYLLMGIVMAGVLCSLTACRDDGYNNNQTEDSVSSSDDESVDENDENAGYTYEETVYEYQQIIDESDGGQAEYSFTFSDSED